MSNTERETIYNPPLVLNKPEQSGTYWFRGKIKDIQIGEVCMDIEYPQGSVVNVGVDIDGNWFMFSDDEMYSSHHIEGQFEYIQSPSWESTRSPDF